ncbi:MAG: DUF4384 domain-containing protein [Pseudomonadota bacterium]
MRGAALWVGGLLLSAVLHVGAAGLYFATRDLDDRPAQQSAESQFQLDTVTAPSQTAEAETPDSEDAAEAAPDSKNVGADAVAQSRASALNAPTTRTEPVAPKAAAVPAVATSGDLMSEATMPDAKAAALPAQTDAAAEVIVPEAAMAQAEDVLSSPVASEAISGDVAKAITKNAATALSEPVPSTVVTANLQPSASPSAPVEVAAATARVERPRASVSNRLSPSMQSAPAASPNSAPAPATTAPTVKPEEPPLPATSATAALAWQFGDRLVTDPQALATIQAFMAPGNLANSAANAGDVKDGLTGLLTSVDCARLSATFVPETGTLELRGHIPDPALQGELLEALRAQVGDGIPVSANLLHLPAPQCGALTGIATVGLPQSTDQFTNDRLVGASAHAREYTYAEGQRLQFDLAAPDYDAFVYVDYFSADGNVIHLVPNETIALEKSSAESLFGVGQDRGDLPSLKITIGPPFGQEIAIAFAASQPLYEGLRPIVEPAEPYLEWLQARVSEARDEDPNFKGEWVYFFITTRPNTQ